MAALFSLARLSRVVVTILSAAVLVFSQVMVPPAFERDVYPKDEDAVRIMSFNVLSKWYGPDAIYFRKDMVVKTIAEYSPDSMGLQEATLPWMTWFKVQLPEYDYVGVASGDGVSLGGFSPIFYLKDKYTVKDSGTFWISETPEKPSKGWDAASKRVCTWAVFENKVTGETYAHINTHLDNEGNAARENGIAMILEKAAEFDIPLVCTGDFNSRENGPFYTQLMAGPLRDTKFLAPDTMSHNTYNGFRPVEEQPRIIIDFILVNDYMSPLVYKVITEGVDGRYVSDHYPLYADMIIDG